MERKALPILLRDALELIEEKYARLYGVEDIADRLGVSKHHLIREFSKAVGTTPGRYLNAVRIEKSKVMLKTTHYPLELIANACGYACANYYCKVFKQLTGMTAARFREDDQITIEETGSFDELFSI